jgi:hypothetical protein
MSNAANIIRIKRSDVASKAPLTTDLQFGELALNTYDGKLFFLNSQDSGNTLNLTMLQQYSAGTNIALDYSTGVISTIDSPTFANVTVTNNLHVENTLEDSVGTTGMPGQLLTSTPTGLEWDATFGTLLVIGRTINTTVILTSFLGTALSYDAVTFRSPKATIITRSGPVYALGS